MTLYTNVTYISERDASMNELALEYFQVANAITTFYVLQSFLFFTAIYKEQALLAVLCRKRRLAVCVTLITGTMYAGIIIYCANMEFSIRELIDSKEINWSVSFGAMYARLTVIGMLAISCAILIEKLLKEKYVGPQRGD